MNKADFIKFNDEEILEIAAELGFKSDDLEENIRFISEKQIQVLFVSRWENTAQYYSGITSFTNTVAIL